MIVTVSAHDGGSYIEDDVGTEIHGYIEVNTIELSNEDLWFRVIDIGVIADRNYEVFGKLFGVRVDGNVEILADSRGIPTTTSNADVLEEDVEEMVKQSWANWSEIKPFLVSAGIGKIDRGWTFLFSAMESLAEIYDGDNVRLVVAFDNFG